MIRSNEGKHNGYRIAFSSGTGPGPDRPDRLQDGGKEVGAEAKVEAFLPIRRGSDRLRPAVDAGLTGF